VTRPAQLVFVTGTATEIGKTWWTAATARDLRRRGLAVAVRKPVQSCAPGEVTDAEVLADATGERPGDVCPPGRTYRLPMAPPIAAAELGVTPFTVADLVAETTWPPAVDIGFVEGAGGPRSPIALDGDNVDLVAALAPDLVVLVADAGLGTINAVRLAAAALSRTELLVALNRFRAGDRLHMSNREFLAGRNGFDLVTDPAELVARLVARCGRR
jgi:dethiobiotin synthase